MPSYSKRFGDRVSSKVPFNPKIVIQLAILQRKHAIIDLIRDYYVRERNGSGTNGSLLGAEIHAFYVYLEPMLYRWLSERTKDRKISFDELKSMILSKDLDSNIKGFRVMNQYLDIKNITKVDTGIDYDSEDTDIEDQMVG